MSWAIALASYSQAVVSTVSSGFPGIFLVSTTTVGSRAVELARWARRRRTI